MNKSWLEQMDKPVVALSPVRPAPRVWKVLSIRQPWAWLILHGGKDVENRDWATKVRGRVLIHAGATMSRADYEACTLFIADMRTSWRLPAYDVLREQCGGIVGSVEIVKCVAGSESPWFCGEFGFVLANPEVREFQPMKGRLGFFEVEL
jgi:hypothetical protein